MYDMQQMQQLNKYAELAPDAWEAFVAFDKAALADGKVSAKTKELIAVAVALTTQCAYCIEIHTKRAKLAGNTDEEIAEAVMVAAALRAGGAVTHGTHCIAK
ncbi:carboxymuconolactone decarboxylase family protein [Aureliella helgolandensis]|uniref:Carboxymuconolactone decarboxylase family protein n=1 Tax=Aureliella helgolandensis TaxID=2527968 RepID=A0A518GB05_9BACT|nr:carboxymuconolactone decarboxylase family protein [Aureliella helgolandensis]QDV25796.1 Carboxymuconolactone decarboxylase family protein [Aureliella helgolandensis]